MKKIVFIFALLMGTLWSLPTIAETYYVKSVHAYLMKSPKRRTKKLKKLVRGTKVEQVSQKGIWYKVEVDGLVGWLPKSVLSQSSSQQRVSILDSKVDISSNARRRVSTYSSTAAARGVVDGGKGSLKKKANDQFTGNYALVEWIEKIKIDEDEAVVFLEHDEGVL